MAQVAWPRTIYPAHNTRIERPGGMIISSGTSGVINRRQIAVPGWRWEEVYNFDLDSDGYALLAMVRRMWNHPTDTIGIEHPALLSPLGAGGGTPLVNGASQTGYSIVTDGWPNSTTVLLAGDIVQFASINRVHMIYTDVTSDGSGNATLALTSPVLANDSPANNAAVSITGSVTFDVVIAEPPVFPSTDAADFIAGLRVVFQETLA